MSADKQNKTANKDELITQLSNENAILNKRCKDLLYEVEQLKLALAIGKGRTFGRKSEQIDVEENTLFNINEVEAIATTTYEKEASNLNDAISNKTQKKKRKNHESIDLEKICY